MLPSYKNQLTDLDWEPIDWFLHDENTRSCLDFCCEEQLVHVLHVFKLNTILTNGPVLHPLKKSENFWFSAVVRGYKMVPMSRNFV